MILLHVHGAGGRLGQAIVRAATPSSGFHVTRSGRFDDLSAPVAACDVAIDVSQPQGSLAIATCCAADGKPLVIGTTGHANDQLQKLKAAAAWTAILLAPNFSVGVNLLFWLTEKANEILGPNFDVEIIELHHRLKKDSPSGTARRLGEIVADARRLEYDKSVRHGREGLTGERAQNEIGIHAVRGGDIVGEHTVLFAGIGERIELTHRALSRDNFAQGALKAARWLVGKQVGLYDMQDVLGLK
jgi:4-hydroxy-tetrahydrodipicolinate reductase